MKVLILLFVGLFILSSFKPSDYCDGFKVGYAEGYCYEIDGCNTPNIPNCPNAKAGYTTYQDGYNRGFSQGKKKQEE